MGQWEDLMKIIHEDQVDANNVLELYSDAVMWSHELFVNCN